MRMRTTGWCCSREGCGAASRLDRAPAALGAWQWTRAGAGCGQCIQVRLYCGFMLGPGTAFGDLGREVT